MGRAHSAKQHNVCARAFTYLYSPALALGLFDNRPQIWETTRISEEQRHWNGNWCTMFMRLGKWHGHSTRLIFCLSKIFSNAFGAFLEWDRSTIINLAYIALPWSSYCDNIRRRFWTSTKLLSYCTLIVLEFYSMLTQRIRSGLYIVLSLDIAMLQIKRVSVSEK